MSAEAKNTYSPLIEAVADSELLLAYAAVRGLPVGDEITKAIVESKNLLNSDPADSNTFQKQAEFWRAREALAKVVGNVTVLSLKATAQKEDDRSLWGNIKLKITGKREKVSAATIAVRRIRLWALLWLVLLLFFQIYWVIGTQITTDIPSVLKEADQIAQKVSAKPDDQSLQAKLATLELDMSVHYSNLERWNGLWRKVIFPGVQAEKIKKVDYSALKKALETAKFPLLAIQLYLLPLLYGLLGAITFVLRSLALEIKAMTYTPEADINYRLRMHMGALAGLIAIWFLQPDASTAEIFKTLSPFALAFLAGYSVEVVFSAMDRFIAAFSNK